MAKLKKDKWHSPGLGPPIPPEKLAHVGNYLLQTFDVTDYKTYKKNPVKDRMKKMRTRGR